MKTSGLYIFIMALLAMSCEKVIDIDLNNAEPQIAIEATLLEGTNDFTTKISKTGNYFGGTPAPVSGAIVTLNNGTTSSVLTDNNDGTYSLPSYLATENTTYTLTVVDEGKTYEAVSTMPTVTNLDTLGFEFRASSAFRDSGYRCYLVFQDDLSIDNYFRGIVTVNGEQTKGVDDLYVFDDSFINGNYVLIPVFGERYNYGDSLTVDMYSLNKAGYDFYNTLNQIVDNSGGGNVAPANPETNWNNGALGIFITAGVSTKKGVVKPTNL